MHEGRVGCPQPRQTWQFTSQGVEDVFGSTTDEPERELTFFLAFQHPVGRTALNQHLTQFKDDVSWTNVEPCRSLIIAGHNPNAVLVNDAPVLSDLVHWHPGRPIDEVEDLVVANSRLDTPPRERDGSSRQVYGAATSGREAGKYLPLR